MKHAYEIIRQELEDERFSGVSEPRERALEKALKEVEEADETISKLKARIAELKEAHQDAIKRWGERIKKAET